MKNSGTLLPLHPIAPHLFKDIMETFSKNFPSLPPPQKDLPPAFSQRAVASLAFFLLPPCHSSEFILCGASLCVCVCKLGCMCHCASPKCVCVFVLRGDHEDAAECLDAAGAGGGGGAAYFVGVIYGKKGSTGTTP